MGVAPDPNRVHLGLVDGRDVLLGDQLLEPHLAVPEIEGVEPLLRLALAAGDGVERLFHGGGELVVDQVPEVALEQLHLGERGPRGDERVSLLPHVVALVHDRVEDARVRRRTADAAILELLHEAGFRVARGRLGAVARRPKLTARHWVALFERRQDGLPVLELRVGVVGTLDVCTEVAGELDRAAGRQHPTWTVHGGPKYYYRT